MLHPHARDRLKRVVPTEYSLEWYDEEIDVYHEDELELSPMQVRYFREDSPQNYPKVVLNMSPMGQPRGEITALNHAFEDRKYKEEHADPDIAYTEYVAAPMSSRLQVTVAVEQDVGAIPRRVVADEVAMQVYHELLFETDHLVDPGVRPDGSELEYSWPLFVKDAGREGVVDTSTTIDERSIQRRSFEFRVDYAYFDMEEVYKTKGLQWWLHVDSNMDGDVDEETGPHWVKFDDDWEIPEEYEQ